MFRTIQAVALILALSVSAAIQAQPLTTGKIAVLNPQAAIMSTEEAQKRIKALNAQPDFDADKKQFEKLKKEYEDMVKQLQKDASVMSAEQKDAQRKKLETKASDIEYLGRKLQGKQQELGQGIMEDMQAKYTKVVTDLIKSENIGLLIDRSAVMHADGSYDITSKVTDGLNKANSQ